MKRFNKWFMAIALLCAALTIDMAEDPVFVASVNAQTSPDVNDFGGDVELATLVNDLRDDHSELMQRASKVKLNNSRVELGRMLFFDKILSGNENISCATCHHSLTMAGDALSLPIGEGATGLGPMRNTGSRKDAVHERVPRNAPHVFNLGLVEVSEFASMFWDGRVELAQGQPHGLRSPAGNDLPAGLRSQLAAQAMFPVTSGTEMAGQAGENPVADAAANGNLAGPDGVWAQLAERLRNNDEYVAMFKKAFNKIKSADEITYVDAANAIAEFESSFGNSLNSPFDRFMMGEKSAMSRSAIKGMKLFYGKATCSSCHAGPLQTSNAFVSIAMPQIGPGKGDGFDGHEDFGRERVTGDAKDRYKFRVPSLRNIAVTGPYGHAGAFSTLESVIRHHMNPAESLENYDRSEAVLPSRDDLDAIDFTVMEDPARRAAIAASSFITEIDLTDREVQQLVDFLHSLTDPAVYQLYRFTPTRVPSGLPVVE